MRRPSPTARRLHHDAQASSAVAFSHSIRCTYTLDAVVHEASDPRIEEVVRRFLVASRALVGVAARSLADVDDVTLPQFRALVVLSTRSATTVSDLASALDIHTTTATRLTDRLVRKRLVRRASRTGDRRVTELHLTAKGSRLVDRVTDRRRREVAEIVGRMPAETWPGVNQALEAFALAAGEPQHVDVFAWESPEE
jgi:DNA-binding MarR family transcriptional regulator